jgi:F-type H+-transporting ATPase subunit epsilon
VAGELQHFLRLEVVSPDGLVFEGDVAMVVVPAFDGEIGVLPRHAPLVAQLAIGELRVRTLSNETISLAVAEGFVKVQNDKVIVLADDAELASEIDEGKVVRARDRALANLALFKEGKAPPGQERIYPAREMTALKTAENKLKVLHKA